MRISDWSSDVCSSDLLSPIETKRLKYIDAPVHGRSCFVMITRTRYKCAACRGEFWEPLAGVDTRRFKTMRCIGYIQRQSLLKPNTHVAEEVGVSEAVVRLIRSEEHTSELQSLMRTSYAVFCLKKKKKY